MLNRWEAAIVMLVLLTVCGCGAHDRKELKRTRAELERTRAELRETSTQLDKLVEEAKVRSYLDELERLDSLKTKGVLTQQEFDRAKQAILDRQSTTVIQKPDRHATSH